MYAIQKIKSNQTKQLNKTPPPQKKTKRKKKENPPRTQPAPPQQLARGRRVKYQDTQCQSGKSWCM